MSYLIKFDEDKAKVFESPATKTDQFPGELQSLDVPKDKKTVVVELEAKGLF